MAGRVISFKADHPRYSYAEVDADDHVVRTAEKKVISSHALAGAYYFARGADFLRVAKELVRRFEQADLNVKELYLSLLYNLLLEEKRTIILHRLEQYRSFGTPEELQGLQWSAELENE